VNVWRPLCLLVTATACGAGKPDARPNAPNVVTITAVDFALTAPDTIPAGLTTLRMINAGREPHQAVVAGAAGKSFAELQGALLKEGAFPEWLTFPGGDGVVNSGDSAIVTVSLAPGNYLLLCYIPSLDGKMHIEKGMYRRLVVVPAPAGTPAAAEPKADVTVTLSDYAFALSTPLTAGTHTIRVENTGPQLHELTIERLEPGKTLADWKAWVAGGMRGTPPAQPAGGLTGPDKGKVGWLTITLSPGEYLLNCYVPDARDGKPHFAHGMVRQVTVS
jgi:uncharacterized cupredoxin-like copper-binding protein